MEKIYEIKAYILGFYTKYSRYIDLGLKFLLALLTFAFINNHVGFVQMLANPVVTVGLAVICTFLPATITTIFASGMVLLHFFSLAPGAAIVAGFLLLVMFAMYFRFAPGNATILLMTPIAFTMRIPILIPVVYGLLGGPVCVIPVTFGIVVYYLIAYVKSYATVIGSVAESGVVTQVTTFTQQVLSNNEMWLTIISFAICLLVVYNIKQLAVDHAWEIAVTAGILMNIIIMAFGHVMLGIQISYPNLIVSSVIAVLVAIIIELFVFSVDYTRAEHLQFEDDEYYYYVKAIPKVSIAVPEKTVKKINVRQDTEEMAGMQVEEMLQETEEEKRFKMEQEESEIQKIIEEELKN